MIERSRVAGFRNQRDLADAVGCRAEQVSRWAQLEKPPLQMRKKFDVKLAIALNVTVKQLFYSYLKTPPAQAGFILELPGPGKEPWKDKNWEVLDSSQKMNVLLYMLGSGGDDVERLIDFGIALVEARESREGRKWSFKDGKLEYAP